MEAERTRLQQGMVQVYTGNGKGKSTAAFGLALRAAGCNMHVVIIQFMKVSGHYAEDEGIRRLGEIVEHYCFGNPGWVKKGEGSGLIMPRPRLLWTRPARLCRTLTWIL